MKMWNPQKLLIFYDLYILLHRSHFVSMNSKTPGTYYSYYSDLLFSQYEGGGTFFIGFIIEYLAKLNAIILIIYSNRPFNVVCELQEFAQRGSD